MYKYIAIETVTNLKEFIESTTKKSNYRIWIHSETRSPYINTETRLAPRIFSPNNTSLSSEENNGETMEDLARA